MAKNINMNRERKIALPVLVQLAEQYLASGGDVGKLPWSDRSKVERAVDAFR